MVESAVDKERVEFEKWAKTLRWDLRLAPASLYPRQPPRYDVTFVQSGWLSWQASAASLRATLAERDAEVERLKDHLAKWKDEASSLLARCMIAELAAARATLRAALSDQPQRREEAKGDFGSPSGLKNHLVSKIDRALHDAQELEMPAQAKELVSQAHVDLHDLAGLLSDDANIRASLSAALSDQPQHQGDGR